MQQPRSLTRFMCCNLDTSISSFLNSASPCHELLDSLLSLSLSLSLSQSINFPQIKHLTSHYIDFTGFLNFVLWVISIKLHCKQVQNCAVQVYSLLRSNLWQPWLLQHFRVMSLVPHDFQVHGCHLFHPMSSTHSETFL
jgi:hypothetical protein